MEPSVKEDESTSVKFLSNASPGTTCLVTTIVSPSDTLADVLLSGKTFAEIAIIYSYEVLVTLGFTVMTPSTTLVIVPPDDVTVISHT